MKSANKMNDEQLVSFNIFVFIGLMMMNLILNLSLMLTKMIYSEMAKYVLIFSVSCFILNIILISFNKKSIKFASYILGTLMGNLTVFSVYLLALNYLKPESSLTKSFFILNFIIVEMILIYYRIIKKDEKYMASVKIGKHGKYVKKDIIVSLVISTINIIISKLFDENPFNVYTKKVDVLLSSFGLIIVSIIAVVLYVTAIANYLYSVKDKEVKR